MKKIIIPFLLFFLKNLTGDSDISLSINAPVHQKSKLALVLLNQKEETIQTANHIKKMLERSEWKMSGFEIDLSFVDSFNSERKLKKYLKEYATGSHLAALFLSGAKDVIEWRLYDTQTTKLIDGKKIKTELNAYLTAEHIAGKVWYLLLGQESFFSTRIAYCKDIKLKSGKLSKEVHIVAPYSNSAEAQFTKRLLSNSNAFALHWNEKVDNPLLFYSESTVRNVRLMSINLDGSKKIVSNFDGMNLFPSISADGQTVVYCISDQGKTQLFLYRYNLEHKTEFKQLTHEGNNISPILLENGDIIFCSDAKCKSGICCYRMDTETIESIVNDGFCTGPSFSKKQNKIAYSKLCNSTMQIFLYDLITKQQHQLTTDNGDKEDCSWSPCGNYLAYSVESAKTSRIAIQNLITNERIYITPAQDRCSYVAWSPNYEMPIAL